MTENETIEQLRVQLAGCGVAAKGYAQDVATDAYGYSASLGDVQQLYAEKERLRALVLTLANEAEAGGDAARAERLREEAWPEAARPYIGVS